MGTDGLQGHERDLFARDELQSEELQPEVPHGSLTPENLASLMAAYFFVKFRKFLVRNSVIYDIIRLYHLS